MTTPDSQEVAGRWHAQCASAPTAARSSKRRIESRFLERQEGTGPSAASKCSAAASIDVAPSRVHAGLDGLRVVPSVKTVREAPARRAAYSQGQHSTPSTASFSMTLIYLHAAGGRRPLHCTPYSVGPHRFWQVNPGVGHTIWNRRYSGSRSSVAQLQVVLPASSKHLRSAPPTMHAPGPASSKLAALRHPGKTVAPAWSEPPSRVPCASGAPSLVWGAAVISPPHPAKKTSAHPIAVARPPHGSTVAPLAEALLGVGVGSGSGSDAASSDEAAVDRSGDVAGSADACCRTDDRRRAGVRVDHAAVGCGIGACIHNAGLGADVRRVAELDAARVSTAPPAAAAAAAAAARRPIVPEWPAESHALLPRTAGHGPDERARTCGGRDPEEKPWRRDRRRSIEHVPVRVMAARTLNLHGEWARRGLTAMAYARPALPLLRPEARIERAGQPDRHVEGGRS
jgi:hypothetical protein